MTYQTPDTGDGARLNLDSERRWLDMAREPVAQGSGAIWILTGKRDLAVGVANALLAEVATLRQSLTDAEASHQADQTPDTGDGAIPAELVAMLDTAAGKTHSVDGIVLSTLAAILKRYDELREASHQAEIARLRAELDEARDGAALIRRVAEDAHARIADLEHAITQYLDSHGTAGTGVLSARLKAADERRAANEHP